MVEPLALISFPPKNIWEAYILFLFIPMILRVFLLFNPFIKVTKQLIPHGEWALKKIKQLPIKGYGLLAFNEFLAFFIPMLVVFIFRISSDPLGWSNWNETNYFGIIIVIVFTLIWIFLDFLRIIRVKNMLNAIEKKNINHLKKIADAGFGIRGVLRKFSKKDEEENKELGKSITKTSLKTWGLLAFKARKLTPAGLLTSVATGAAIEVARKGAGKVSEIIDEKMQKEFEKFSAAQSSTLLILFIRDIVMGIAPLVILWIVQLAFP
ncbi:MAG: hypothetical protein CMB64_04440 [Euryarchaeota archaeon]|nr:hypothetical protein [Euryarchaeota archaeon]